MAPSGAAVAAPIAASARDAEIRITLFYKVQQCNTYVSNRRKLCPMKSASYRFVPCRTRSYPVVHPVVPIVTTHGRERSTKI